MTTLAKSTRIRLIKDIKEMMNYSENNKNIFYKHSEEDLLTGYALIGDEDSLTNTEIICFDLHFRKIILFRH